MTPTQLPSSHSRRLGSNRRRAGPLARRAAPVAAARPRLVRLVGGARRARRRSRRGRRRCSGRRLSSPRRRRRRGRAGALGSNSVFAHRRQLSASGRSVGEVAGASARRRGIVVGCAASMMRSICSPTAPRSGACLLRGVRAKVQVQHRGDRRVAADRARHLDRERAVAQARLDAASGSASTTRCWPRSTSPRTTSIARRTRPGQIAQRRRGRRAAEVAGARARHERERQHVADDHPVHRPLDQRLGRRRAGGQSARPARPRRCRAAGACAARRRAPGPRGAARRPATATVATETATRWPRTIAVQRRRRAAGARRTTTTPASAVAGRERVGERARPAVEGEPHRADVAAAVEVGQRRRDRRRRSRWCAARARSRRAAPARPCRLCARLGRHRIVVGGADHERRRPRRPARAAAPSAVERGAVLLVGQRAVGDDREQQRARPAGLLLAAQQRPRLAQRGGQVGPVLEPVGDHLGLEGVDRLARRRAGSAETAASVPRSKNRASNRVAGGSASSSRRARSRSAESPGSPTLRDRSIRNSTLVGAGAAGPAAAAHRVGDRGLLRRDRRRGQARGQRRRLGRRGGSRGAHEISQPERVEACPERGAARARGRARPAISTSAASRVSSVTSAGDGRRSGAAGSAGGSGRR